MKVTVVGLGYVGSVAAVGLAKAGHQVTGVDVDWEKIEKFRGGLTPSYEPGLHDLVSESASEGRLRFLHTSEVDGSLGEAMVIATGTPPKKSGGADLSYVKSALAWVVERQPEGGTIVMKSTVPPGTGARLMDTHLKGTRLDYVANPEFLREGQAINDWFHPDRIVAGVTQDGAVPVMRELYRGIEAPYVVTDITSAEMIKYSANAYLATKISFINEIAMLCDRLGATIDDVVRGIALDPRIGPSFLRAGVGYGGSCFPKDTRALDDLALNNGHNFELLRAVITVNSRQRLLPLYALRRRFGKLLGVTVGVLGLAFKPHTDDVRESPAIDLINALADEGAYVKATDPSALGPAAKVVGDGVLLCEDVASCAEGSEALVLMTEWPQFVEADWETIASVAREPRFLFDGRNALDPARMRELGFAYCGVGRGEVSSDTALWAVHAGARRAS